MEKKKVVTKGSLARQLMAALLVLIAVSVVLVFVLFGLKDPDKGPGNMPASGDATPLRNNGSPPTSK